jgi:hypothetical protein
MRIVAAISRRSSRQNFTIARVSAECVAPGRLKSGDTQSEMACARAFLATCREYKQGARVRDLSGD